MFLIVSADILQGVSNRAFYSASDVDLQPRIIIARSRAGLDTQVGEARLCEVVLGASFAHFRRATQTPFNLILEAKP